MNDLELDKLRYPIGHYIAPEKYTSKYINEKIAEIASFPERLKKGVSQLSNKQLDTAYRPDGWTIRQVVHHCADSYINCFSRIKWALTEDTPIIKFYHEELWAEMHDNRTMPIAPTLSLLEGLHFRLAYLMSSLSENDLQKSFIHPANNKEYKIEEIIGTYAWHSNHHLAHVTELKKRKSW
ncbi:YfiT family bacillithiol transferase [Flavobacterium cellulosilyticum]|uniref:Putative metal-dependent hydrolase n=1 Tax=Flavobacterium cellulosilyticum TaxID=2541731 RepID=A0A4R5CKK4_9FLAO|nr:putative metal-dependent hydrolase [Flavobacterium cellulosilyticum]TDD99150.1 putative metal-dependent hydrolase [Flavobacterium cellulosilyticum]